MKKMSWRINLIRAMLLIGIIALIGCSNGGVTPPVPSSTQTLTFGQEGGTLNYTGIDVSVYVPADAIMPGETVPLAVQVAPANLPGRSYSDSIYERVGWIELSNTGDPLITLQHEMIVEFPLDMAFLADEPKPNESYTLFYYDQSSGKWANTGTNGVITDDGAHAIFSANAFGTWGIFRAVPLTVDAYADRTTAKAPASISLTANIDGGSPPYAIIWWFGDDSDPESGINVGHFYEFPIKYTASCIVVDAKNRQIADTIDISLH